MRQEDKLALYIQLIRINRLRQEEIALKQFLLFYINILELFLSIHLLTLFHNHQFYYYLFCYYILLFSLKHNFYQKASNLTILSLKHNINLLYSLNLMLTNYFIYTKPTLKTNLPFMKISINKYHIQYLLYYIANLFKIQ